MSKITSELLAKLAPGTKPANVRDRFVPFLNEACPRYGIMTELRVAAFLATICFESNYFRATREGRARSGSKVRAVQDRYWGTGFFGRGLIQTTHRKNYVLFSQAMFKAGQIETEFLFVDQPELLEQPKWAVESACYFWQSNNLNSYADRGKFFAIQGLTNRGNATQEAWGYDDRANLYETALRFMPDDFSLISADASPNAQPPTGDSTAQSAPAEQPQQTANGGAAEQLPSDQATEQTAFETGAGETAVSTTTKNEQDVTIPAVVDGPKPYNEIGLKGTLINDAKPFLPANGIMQTFSEYAQQATGWPPWVVGLIGKLALILLVVTTLWIIYRVLSWAKHTWVENERVKLTATINSDVKRKDMEIK